jgi:serine/threonine protein kinase
MSSDFRPGTVLAGKYRIEKVLGQGAMGVVVAARHLRLDEDVAIKFLLPAALENRETLARFEREAQAAAKIRSEHVARVRDVGRLESGAPYMVMEHLSGVDLKEYLVRSGPLPVEEAVHYLLQACEALAEAHSLGIVHRDLKPANMFRTSRADGTPSIKILDFGISKLQNSDAGMTQTSTMMGSPYYMSPEQMMSSKDVDARTDVWALGVILHQLLAGEVPFGGDSIGEVCAKLITTEAPRLSDFRDDLPPGLQEVIDRTLVKDRSNRLSNVAEFAQALVPFGQEGDAQSANRVSRVLGFIPPSTVRVSGASPLAQKEEAEHTLGGAAHTQREESLPKKPTGPWLWGSAAALSILAIFGYFAASSGDSKLPATAGPESPGKAPDDGETLEARGAAAAHGPSQKARESGSEPDSNPELEAPEKSEVRAPSPPSSPKGQGTITNSVAPEKGRPAPGVAPPTPSGQDANVTNTPPAEPPPEPVKAPAPALDPSEFYRDRR